MQGVRRIGAVVLSAVALLAAGCGDNGDDNTSGETSPTGSTQGQQPYRGGEKSIEEFGEEAGGPERAALLGAFHAYFGALAGKDYRTACSYLAAVVHDSLEQLAGKRSKGVSCPAILPKILAPTAAAIAREQVEGRVTKVRVEGDRAFVVFHAPGAKLYQLTMEREGGGWKATTVAASVLVPSAATLGR